MVYHRTQRSEQRRAGTQAKILRAAAKLFLRRGYEHTTMQDIVKAARTSVGNLYFYFKNKEALLATLLEEAATAAWSWADEAVVDVPRGPARLAVMAMANAQGLLGPNAGLTRILVMGANTAQVREQVIQRFAARIRAFILDNIPSYPVEHIDLTVTAWLGAGRYVIEQRLAGRLHENPQELGEFIVRWNLRGVGIAEPEIDEAIAIASRVLAEQNKKGGRKRAPRPSRLTPSTSPT